MWISKNFMSWDINLNYWIFLEQFWTVPTTEMNPLLDLNMLQEFLQALTPEDLQDLFTMLKTDVTATGMDIEVPEKATVQATIFLAQLLAQTQLSN